MGVGVGGGAAKNRFGSEKFQHTLSSQVSPPPVGNYKISKDLTRQSRSGRSNFIEERPTGDLGAL